MHRSDITFASLRPHERPYEIPVEIVFLLFSFAVLALSAFVLLSLAVNQRTRHLLERNRSSKPDAVIIPSGKACRKSVKIE